jgi:hypothetical protein
MFPAPIRVLVNFAHSGKIGTALDSIPIAAILRDHIVFEEVLAAELTPGSHEALQLKARNQSRTINPNQSKINPGQTGNDSNEIGSVTRDDVTCFLLSIKG